MPHFYNEAAHLLLTLTRQGLIIAPGVDARTIVHRLAILMEEYLRDNPALSHAGAAQWMLDDITKTDSQCSTTDRRRLIAVIGTIVGNLQTSGRAA